MMSKKKMIFLYIILLCIIPGCYKQRITTNKEKNKIIKSSEESIGMNPYHQQQEITLNNEEIMEIGISRDLTVQKALYNNSHLMSMFEEIGIKKAELVQAATFSNPRFESAFSIPVRKYCVDSSKTKTEIELDLTFRLSDIWQVPIKKKIAQENLEETMVNIMQSILNVTAQAKETYYTCLHAQASYNQAKKTYFALNKLNEATERRYHYGYGTELDILQSELDVLDWELTMISKDQEQKRTHINLRALLGIDPSVEHIKVTDPLPSSLTELPSLDEIKRMISTHNPVVQIARINVERTYHIINLEHTRIFDNVSAGVNYLKDYFIVNEVGPLFGFDVPIFDNNHANIDKAEREHDKARNELEHTESGVISEVIVILQNYKELQKLIAVYEHNIIPTTHKKIIFAQKLFDSMQAPETTVLEEYITLYKHEQKLIDLYYEVAKVIINLEHTIGCNIVS